MAEVFQNFENPMFEKIGKNLNMNIHVIHVFFINIVLFNLRLEYASVFHKSSLKICLRYAYLRTLK